MPIKRKRRNRNTPDWARLNSDNRLEWERGRKRGMSQQRNWSRLQCLLQLFEGRRKNLKIWRSKSIKGLMNDWVSDDVVYWISSWGISTFSTADEIQQTALSAILVTSSRRPCYYDRRKRMASTDKIMLLIYVSILIFGSFLTGYFFICLMSLDLLITDGCYQ